MNAKQLIRIDSSILRPLIALVVMSIALAFASESFATADNLFNVMRQVSVNLCISVGMTLVILTGGIDLSVGSILALSGAVAAGLIKSGVSIEGANLHIGFTFFGVVIVALVIGGALGWFNGQMVTRFKVPPFIATLGMLTIARGLTMLYTNGHPITGLGASFEYLGTGWFCGVPMPVLVAALVVVLFALFMRKSPWGRYIYAIGGNERATRLSGIDVNRVKCFVYTVAGVLSAVAALIVTARLDSAQPNAGTGYELDSIAAVVIGGTSLNGGKGSVWGTVVGALIIGVLNNGLVLLNVSPFWQQVIKGLVILLAVVMDRMNAKEQ